MMKNRKQKVDKGVFEMMYEVLKNRFSMIKLGRVALVIPMLLICNEGNCQLRKSQKAVDRCLKGEDDSGFSLTRKDHLILDAIGNPRHTGNILAAYLEDGTMIFLESGTSVTRAVVARNEIREWNEALQIEVIDMATLIATLIGGNIGIRVKGGSESDIRNRINGFISNARLDETPDNAREDILIIDGLTMYARVAHDAAQGVVYGRSPQHTDGMCYATWPEGKNEWENAAENLKRKDPSEIKFELSELLKVLESPAISYRSLTTQWQKDNERAVKWLRRAMHTEVQLQILAKNNIIKLQSKRPILSAFRPCPSCSQTPAVQLWCSPDSDTPFYCTWADSSLNDHPNDKLVAHKQPRGGYAQAYRVVPCTNDDNREDIKDADKHIERPRARSRSFFPAYQKESQE